MRPFAASSSPTVEELGERQHARDVPGVCQEARTHRERRVCAAHKEASTGRDRACGQPSAPERCLSVFDPTGSQRAPP
jgi:hypothetical protein